MKNIIKQFLQDKNGNFSLREVVTMIFMLIILGGWAGEQFLHFKMPEYMFYSFVSLIGATCFGYSLEKKSNLTDTNTK